MPKMNGKKIPYPDAEKRTGRGSLSYGKTRMGGGGVAETSQLPCIQELMPFSHMKKVISEHKEDQPTTISRSVFSVVAMGCNGILNGVEVVEVVGHTWLHSRPNVSCCADTKFFWGKGSRLIMHLDPPTRFRNRHSLRVRTHWITWSRLRRSKVYPLSTSLLWSLPHAHVQLFWKCRIVIV